MASNRAYYDGEAEYLSIPTTEGVLGIMAHHENMIAAVVPGMLEAIESNMEQVQVRVICSVSSGLLKVEDNEVMVLADTVETPEEIDVNRALRAEARAKEELLQKKSRIEYYQAEINLAKAVSRLKVAKLKK